MPHTRLSALVLICVLLLTSACLQRVVVEPQVPRPDLITQPSLRAFLRSSSDRSIVLRVPNDQRGVTQQSNLDETSAAIEKELVRAGFTVRDRKLLNQVTDSGRNLDYPTMLAITKAQLMLDIVSIKPRRYDTPNYVRADNHRAGTARTPFHLLGWQFECKVILVGSGEIGGIYTVDVPPRGAEFLLNGNKVLNGDGSGGGKHEQPGYQVRIEDAARPFVQTLLRDLASAR
jgi:hypothetical protein